MDADPTGARLHPNGLSGRAHILVHGAVCSFHYALSQQFDRGFGDILLLAVGRGGDSLDSGYEPTVRGVR